MFCLKYTNVLHGNVMVDTAFRLCGVTATSSERTWVAVARAPRSVVISKSIFRSVALVDRAVFLQVT
jgi:hypothetical protein